MKILLTGATGMVGKNILEHTDIALFEVLAPSRGELDLLYYSAVERYIKNHNPDLIIHAAGTVGGIQANIREPVKFLLENLDMGRNIVWASRNCGVRKLVNLGSSCMYPRDAVNPLDEDMILKGELEPTNESYAIAKIAVAKLCEYIVRESPDFQYKTLIPCNLYGRWDKFDTDHSHMIPGVIKKIHDAKVSGQNKVIIWGDGTVRREFMYAGDFADCIVYAIKNFDTMPSLMNVGLGYDFTINEYYEAIESVIGYTGIFTHDLSKPVGMVRKLVNIEKQLSWGWKSKTSLTDGLASTYKFYLEHLRT